MNFEQFRSLSVTHIPLSHPLLPPSTTRMTINNTVTISPPSANEKGHILARAIGVFFFIFILLATNDIYTKFQMKFVTTKNHQRNHHISISTSADVAQYHVATSSNMYIFFVIIFTNYQRDVFRPNTMGQDHHCHFTHQPPLPTTTLTPCRHVNPTTGRDSIINTLFCRA